MTLRQKIKLIYGLLIAGGVLALLSVSGEEPFIALAVLSAAVLITSAVLEACWHHCPYCGALLGRNIFPRFCPRCGEEIDYDVKNS